MSVITTGRQAINWHVPILAIAILAGLGAHSGGVNAQENQQPSVATVKNTSASQASLKTAAIKGDGDGVRDRMSDRMSDRISEGELTALVKMPLYQMKPREVGRYLAYLHDAEPDLRARVANLARKNIGQPYQIFLLGEYPYEIHDNNPMFSLERSDCVVFAEHTYAMALSSSWEEFFWMLQRIRYANGVVGVTTRNHYTEADWNVQNAWLLSDISAEVAGDRVARYSAVIDRAAFLKKMHRIDAVIPPQTINETYVPKTAVTEVLAKLKAGDFVNVISLKGSPKDSQNDGEFLASHVGLVVIGTDGERRFLHSSEPAVREESFNDFINRAESREARNRASGKSGLVLKGFKFLRLNEHPNVPPMAPQPRPQSAL